MLALDKIGLSDLYEWVLLNIKEGKLPQEIEDNMISHLGESDWIRRRIEIYSEAQLINFYQRVVETLEDNSYSIDPLFYSRVYFHCHERGIDTSKLRTLINRSKVTINGVEMKFE